MKLADANDIDFKKLSSNALFKKKINKK